MKIIPAIPTQNYIPRRAYFHAAVFIVALLVIISRRPDAVFNPQFWAEDGTIFYAESYNNGSWQSLFSTYAGYLHAVPRLTAAFAMYFPLKVAPLIFNLFAIIIQILPVNLFVSSRFSWLVPNIKYRIYISFLYLVLPGCFEIHANITNAQWRIALLLFMVMITPALSLIHKIFDVILISIGSLTGPFSAIMMPIIPFFIISRKKRIHQKNYPKDSFFYPKLILLVIVSILHLIVIFNDKQGQGRISKVGVNVFSIETLTTIAKIFSNQLILMSTLGSNLTAKVIKIFPEQLYTYVSLLLLVFGIIFLIYLFRKSPLELSILIIFSALIPLIAIASALPDIALFTIINYGGRYWFSLVLSFSIGILWLCQRVYRKKQNRSKVLVGIVFVTMLIGIVNDWRHPDFKDYKFNDYADKFQKLPIGSEIVIPINPDPWLMKLIKK